jgi:hypothetical protein
MLLTFGRYKSEKLAVVFRLSVAIQQSNCNMAMFAFAVTNQFTSSCSTLIPSTVKRNLTVNLALCNAFFFLYFANFQSDSFICNSKLQPQDSTFIYLFIFTGALHVSGGSSAHHQEHTTVHTASGIVNQYCC